MKQTSYIYNKVKGSLTVAAGLLAMAGGLTACSDFLDLEPINEIVEDNFWNEESDVDNMIAGCYSSLQSQAVIDRMLVWGEARSENISAGPQINDDSSLGNILKENITASNGYLTWVDFYYVINKCNLIIARAPQVAEKDPNYTQSEVLATIAEASALRDLCYFYLIRTFRDVPYTTEAYTDDTQTMALPASSFEDVLNALIADLESVQNNAVKTYPENKTYYQTGRITQDAIHAMLCDMYLWKGDYENAVKYADLVINSFKDKYEENSDKYGGISSGMVDKLINGFPLISDEATSGNNRYGSAANSIFFSGNSSESIFELTYMDDNTMLANSSLSYRYGNATNMGNSAFFKASEYVTKDVSEAQYKVFHNKYDTRAYENMTQAQAITKYVCGTSVDFSETEPSSTYAYSYPEKYCHANWIIYRLTDVMLMKAEALTQLVSTSDSTATLSETDENYLRSALYICNAVNKRSYGQKNQTDTLAFRNYRSKELMQNLVFDERERELMFEGKRWYDLVRRSRRDGNTTYLVEHCTLKGVDNATVVRSKLGKMDAIYWPYHEDELKVNSNLVQNSAFGSGDNNSYDINY